MNYEDAVEDWKSNDEWQFADNGACWKFMFEKGQESIRQQLAAALAACKLKDGALDYMHREKCDYMSLNNLGIPVHETSYTLAVKALSTTPDQALEQFAAKVRDQCATVCENECSYTVFHTDQRAAINCAAAIRAIKELPK